MSREPVYDLAPLAPHEHDGTCWWCTAEADSREHRHKASDLRREFAEAEYRAGDVQLTGVGRNRRLQSASSKHVKFARILCARCNNQRSQPFDRAYDEFIEWYLAHEDEIETSGLIEFDEIYADWEQDRANLLRYFVKHIGCRMVDAEWEVPVGFVDCLNNSGHPLGLVCSFEINGTLSGLNQIISNHPTSHGTAGNLWLGPLHAQISQSAGTATEFGGWWGYHGLQLVWLWRAQSDHTGTNLVGPKPTLPRTELGGRRGLIRVSKPGLAGVAWRGWYQLRRAIGLGPKLPGEDLSRVEGGSGTTER